MCSARPTSPDAVSQGGHRVRVANGDASAHHDPRHEYPTSRSRRSAWARSSDQRHEFPRCIMCDTELDWGSIGDASSRLRRPQRRRLEPPSQGTRSANLSMQPRRQHGGARPGLVGDQSFCLPSHPWTCSCRSGTRADSFSMMSSCRASSRSSRLASPSWQRRLI
jgi:hypothetical protein